ncbi:IS21 family transposase [Paenibacillus sp. LHD-117]|uniref:IS21 family transposase n=1 Tax=Paenibacillus sp. LHD-117 TaxID=3071412 RepID=UPI0027E12D21|nr:IS21 family transposase [Paenibacillus sp. LHD-117]MDQ6420480.1 IS21 family transposase [Paenibacillus sp. LHD-117]
MKDMLQRGMNITQIAEELGRDRKTVRKWLEQDQPGSYQERKPVTGKLDGYKDYIRSRMAEGCLNARVMLDEIRERGYIGSITILRIFMQPLRPVVQSKATERFETQPGQQAQVDWGHFRIEHDGSFKRLYAFVKVLGYSRAMYVEFTEDERLETLMGCHIRAFEYFGGITQTCLYDNMKTVVTGHDENGEVVWNERFARFAKHYGFVLRRCKPYRARTKGKVENGVGYVRKNFWPRVRTFSGLQDLNSKVRHWLDTVANRRLHGTTFQVPLELWKEENLQPVTEISFAYADRLHRKVSADCYVSYEANRYSVPFTYVGTIVEVQDEKNGTLRFYCGGALIAEHPKSLARHQIISNKKHFEGIRTAASRPVGEPTPRYVPNAAPEVLERPLSAYDALMEEVVLQ